VEEAVFAVVRTGGKQYRVQEGRSVRVDRLPGEAGASIELSDVLMMGEGDDITIGAPTVAGARVLGTIAEQGRAKKIIVFKYKSKTRARKKTGHRQHFTTIVVDDILAAGQQPKPKVEKAKPEPEAEAAPKGRRGRRSKATPEAAAAEAPAEEISAEAPEAEAPEITSEGESAAEAPETSAAPEATEESPAEKPKRTRKKAE
jgi:large subunit ribosomal protein L21